MGKGFSKQNWMWGIFGVAACSMLSFSSSAYAGTAFANATEVQQPLRGSISVHGVVKDQNGEPIIGASVKLVGYKAATVTDIDGNFALQVMPGGTLEISYVAIQPRT